MGAVGVFLNRSWANYVFSISILILMLIEFSRALLESLPEISDLSIFFADNLATLFSGIIIGILINQKKLAYTQNKNIS